MGSRLVGQIVILWPKRPPPFPKGDRKGLRGCSGHEPTRCKLKRGNGAAQVPSSPELLEPSVCHGRCGPDGSALCYILYGTTRRKGELEREARVVWCL